MKKMMMVFVFIITLIAVMTGCGSDDTVQTCIISNMSYSSQSDLEKATQTDTIHAEEPAYATVQFIESPKGMEYSVKWYINDVEIKDETKATVNDMTDIVVYELESEQVVEGTLKIEVIYQDTVLYTSTMLIN